MNKKIVFALATSLVLANASSTAFAANVSNSDNSGSSTTIPGTRDKSKLTGAQANARKFLEQAAKNAITGAHDQDLITFKAELRAYISKRAEIKKACEADMADAWRNFNTVLRSATSNLARRVARDAFFSAGKIARQNCKDALEALGPPPAKPVKP